jgi:MFS family permease
VLGSACCIFLMVYLPPASWWRFVGWLVLGASIYCLYGFSNSVIGRRAGRNPVTPGFMKAMGFGFFVAAMGLFVVPHNAGPGQLLGLAGDEHAIGHTRSQIGLVLVATGLVLTAIGALTGRSRRSSAA